MDADQQGKRAIFLMVDAASSGLTECSRRGGEWPQGLKPNRFLWDFFGIRCSGKSCPEKKLLFAEVAND
jgi:hypothetical protein